MPRKLGDPEVIRARTRTATAEGLTPLEDRFVMELLADPRVSAGEALLRAGSKAKSPSVASQGASQMLAKPRVIAALQERRSDLRAALGLDALEVARKLKELVEADIPDIFDEDGTLLELDKWPPGTRAAVSSITFDNPVFVEDEHGQKVKKPRIKSVKFTDKLKTWEMLIRLLDIQPPKRVDVTSNGQSIGTQVLVIGDKKIEF